MEKNNQQHRQLQQGLSDRKIHYKLYKAGKTWLIAGIATVTFGVTAAVHTAHPVLADATTTSSDSSSATDTSSSSVALKSSTSSTSSSSTTADSTSSDSATSDAANMDTSTTGSTSADNTSTTAASDSSSAAATTTSDSDSAATNSSSTSTDSASSTGSTSDSGSTSAAKKATNTTTATATAKAATSSAAATDTNSTSTNTDSTGTTDASITDASADDAGLTTGTTTDNATATANTDAATTADITSDLATDTTVQTTNDALPTTTAATTDTQFKTQVAAAYTTANTSNANGLSVSINGGGSDETGTVTYNSDTASNDSAVDLTVTGSFTAGETLTINVGTNSLSYTSMSDVDGASESDTTETVDGTTEPVVTISFDSTVASTSFDVYFGFNSDNNGDDTSTLATGDATDTVPVTLTVTNADGATVAADSDNLTVEKSYTANDGDATSLSYNLFNTGDSKVTAGTVSDGTATSDITWALDLSGNTYPGDYSTIPTGSTITTTDAGSTLVFTVPDTVQVDTASLASTLTDAGLTVSTTDNTITVTYPAGMTMADVANLEGDLNVTLSAVTAPTTATTYAAPSIAMNWNVDGTTVAVTDNSTNDDGDALAYVDSAVSSTSSIGYVSTANTDLTTFTDAGDAGSDQYQWTVADTSNYDYGGTLDATLTLASSNSDTAVGVKTVSGLTDSNLADMGLDTNVSLTFTTADGTTDTQAYTSGTDTYTTDLGSATDPVVSVELTENAANTTLAASTADVTPLTVAITTYGTTAPTTLTATSTTNNVESDGTVVAGTPVTTSRDYSDNGVAVVNSWTPSGDSIYTPGGSTGYDLNVNVVSNSLDVDYAAYANLSTTSAGVMLSDSGAAAEAFEAANPLTVVVIAPANTTLASDADIVDALMNANAGGSIATSADKITITHLADYDGQEAIAISGLDNYLADSQITIPLTVDADATAGTAIASSDTVFVEPSSALISVDGTTLTSLGSVEADYAAGNLYNVTDTPDQIIGTVEASQTVAASDAVQGSADAAAQLTTGTINADDDTATGKTMLYNGSDTDVTDSSTTVNLASDGTQVISLTGAPTITSSDGSTITTAMITYDTSDGTTTTDPTQAASFTVTNLPVSTGETVTISYPMTVDSTVLAGTTTGIQWPYTTAVQFYSDGTLAAGDATALGTETDTTMNLQAVHNLTDTWYLATQDSDGNYVAGEEVGTYAGTTGTTYSASTVTNLAVGDTASNGDVVVGYYDESTGTMVTDPTALTMVENETADGQVAGTTYYVVTAPATETTTVSYTVTYTGAGDATPATGVNNVTWTGTLDPTTDTYTWTADAPVTVTTPTITGYTADSATAFSDVPTTSTMAPTAQTATVTYTPDQETVAVHYYLDGTTTSVAPDATLTGAYGSAYTSTAATVSGYTLTTTPANATGTYGTDNSAVIYYYTLNSSTSGDTGTGTSTGTTTGNTGTSTGTTTGSDTGSTTGDTGTTSSNDTGSTTATGTGTTSSSSTGATSGTTGATTTTGNNGTSGGDTVSTTAAAASRTTGTQSTGTTGSANAGSGIDGAATAGSTVTVDSNSTSLTGTATNTEPGQSSATEAKTTKLPQTNENDSTSELAEASGLGLFALLAGLFGFRLKRKHN